MYSSTEEKIGMLIVGACIGALIAAILSLVVYDGADIDGMEYSEPLADYICQDKYGTDAIYYENTEGILRCDVETVEVEVEVHGEVRLK